MFPVLHMTLLCIEAERLEHTFMYNTLRATHLECIAMCN
jgi:hypothetical protein